MTQAQTERIQRMLDSGSKVAKVAEMHGGVVEVETGWGWLRFGEDGREVSRLRREDMHTVGA